MEVYSPVRVRENAEFALEQVNTWINNIDGKVSNALTFSGVLIGFILIQGTPQAFADFAGAERIEFFVLFKALLVAALYLTSLVAICFFLNAILCRITVSNDPRSHLFFGTIQTMTYQEYSEEFRNLTEDAYIAELLEQIHTNSTICNKKVNYYNQGIRVLFIAVILCFACFVFRLV